jgi:hypothetical protein
MTSSAKARTARRQFRFVRAGRCVAVLLSLNACHSWQPQAIGPTTDFGATTRVRVERNDGSSVVLIGPRIESDSLVGPWAGSWDRTAVAISDIRHAEALRTSRTRTTLAVVGVVGGVTIIVGAFLAAVAVGLGSTMGAPAF